LLSNVKTKEMARIEKYQEKVTVLDYELAGGGSSPPRLTITNT